MDKDMEGKLAWFRENVVAQWQLITPEKAEKMLTRNTNNYRSINKKAVYDYAYEMANGDWQPNGEPIVFDEEGRLLNGQHRLNAVVKSKTSIICLVVYGIPKTVDVYDFQKRRSLTDILKASGSVKANNSIVAAANVIVWDFKAGDAVHRTSRAAVKFVEKNYELLARAHEICSGASHSQVGRLSPVLAAVFSILVYEKDEQGVADLMKIVNTGMPLEGVSSYSGLMLRRAILSTRGKMAYEERCRYLYDATYQAYLEQKKGTKRMKIYTNTGKSKNLFAYVKMTCMPVKGEMGGETS